MAENDDKPERFAWIDDRVYGYIKVKLEDTESNKKDNEAKKKEKPQAKTVENGNFVVSNGKIGRVRNLDSAAGTLELEFGDETVEQVKELTQSVHFEAKLTIQTQSGSSEKIVYVDVNEPCHLLFDNIREELGDFDFTFMQLLASNRLINAVKKPKEIDVAVEVVEDPRVKIQKEEEEKKKEEEAKKAEEIAEKQPEAESEKKEEVSPEEPVQPIAENVEAVEQKIDEKSVEIAEKAPEEVTPEQKPAEETPVEEEKKVEEVAKSTFEHIKPLKETEDQLTLDRYAKIGEYELKTFENLEVYIENNEGYEYAQSYDHILITEQIPSVEFSALLSITTPLILRGIGIAGPCRSIVGKPILDFTILAMNITSGEESYIRVKKEGSSEKVHYYYLEPPLACRPLDQVQFSFDWSDDVAKRGRYLKVKKDDPPFFGLDGTKLSIDCQKNDMIAAISYTLEQETLEKAQ